MPATRNDARATEVPANQVERSKTAKMPFEMVHRSGRLSHANGTAGSQWTRLPAGLLGRSDGDASRLSDGDAGVGETRLGTMIEVASAMIEWKKSARVPARVPRSRMAAGADAKSRSPWA